MKHKNLECENTKYKMGKEIMKTSTGRSTLTWMQDFLGFWVTGTEGRVELEMVDIVEESRTDREEDVLKVKEKVKVQMSGVFQMVSEISEHESE